MSNFKSSKEIKMNSEQQLTDAEVDAFLAEPVPFDAACDRRIAEKFKNKWIAATAEANHRTPQCNHVGDVKCSRCCGCEECAEIRLSDAAAAFDTEFPNWLQSGLRPAPEQMKDE